MWIGKSLENNNGVRTFSPITLIGGYAFTTLIQQTGLEFPLKVQFGTAALFVACGPSLALAPFRLSAKRSIGRSTLCLGGWIDPRPSRLIAPTLTATGLPTLASHFFWSLFFVRWFLFHGCSLSTMSARCISLRT
jgi:hypothetical protein